MYTPSCPSRVSWHDCADRAGGLGGRRGEQVCTAVIRRTSVPIWGLSASATPRLIHMIGLSNVEWYSASFAGCKLQLLDHIVIFSHTQSIPTVAAFICRKRPQSKANLCYQYLALAMPHFWAAHLCKAYAMCKHCRVLPQHSAAANHLTEVLMMPNCSSQNIMKTD